MSRLRALCAIAVIAGALIVPGSAGPACASGPHAGLVVDTGGRVLRYCVALPSASVSGAKLIELAGAQYGLDYHFGSGGAAVCRLAGLGPDSDDCFSDYPDYWGYWRETGSGGWSWSSVGATSTTVSDGDVDGWAWGRGDDGSTHPKPPASTFSSVCAAAVAARTPTPKPAPRTSSPPSSTPAVAASSRPTPSPKEREHHRPRHHHREHHGPAERASHVRLKSRPRGVPLVAHQDPPIAGLLGIAGVCLVGVAGTIVSRRRRTKTKP